MSFISGDVVYVGGWLKSYANRQLNENRKKM